MEEIAGMSIPFRIDPASGRIVWATGEEKLKENIIHIVLTAVGERTMRREYGGGVSQLVHDPNSLALQAIIQRQIGQSITHWEPRVLLQGVSVESSPNMTGTVVAHVRYTIRQTQQEQSVSVPIGLGGF